MIIDQRIPGVGKIGRTDVNPGHKAFLPVEHQRQPALAGMSGADSPNGAGIVTGTEYPQLGVDIEAAIHRPHEVKVFAEDRQDFGPDLVFLEAQQFFRRGFFGVRHSERNRAGREQGQDRKSPGGATGGRRLVCRDHRRFPRASFHRLFLASTVPILGERPAMRHPTVSRAVVQLCGSTVGSRERLDTARPGGKTQFCQTAAGARGRAQKLGDA